MYGCVNKERVPRHGIHLERPTEWMLRTLYLEPLATDNWSLYIQVLFTQFLLAASHA